MRVTLFVSSSDEKAHHMSDTEIAGAAELTPEEQKFFDTHGESEIPSGDKSADTGAADNTDGADKTGPDGTKPEKVEQMVSLAALHEERGKRKELGTKLQATERELAELRGKFSIIEKLQQGGKEPEAPLTPEGDIFGYVKKLGETNEQLQKRIDDGETARKEEIARNSLVTNYRSDAAAFTAKTPDYMDAYNHLLKSRAEELAALGHDDPATITQMLQNEEIAIANLAFAKGKSPAEIIYGLAKMRGYAKSDGGANDAAAKLDSIARGQQANKSLSNTGGNAGDGEMTAETLLKMPNDEFEAWCKKNPAKAKRIMGG